MEKFNRAVRRHHIERLKNTRKNYWGYNRPFIQTDIEYTRTEDGRYINSKVVLDSKRGSMKMSPKQLGAVIQHPQVCSGPCCSMSRKYYGKTLKEICFIYTEQEQVNEMKGD